MKKRAYIQRSITTFIVWACISSAIFSLNTLAVGSDGNLIDEMDDTSKWKALHDCTISLDTSNKVFGNASLKLASTKTEGGGDFSIQSNLGSKLDYSDLKNIEINIYSSNVKQLNTVSLYLMTNDGNFYYNYIGSWELMRGWSKIRRTAGDFSKQGSPDWSNITKYMVKVEAAPGASPEVNIDRISFNIIGKTSILFTFDDSWYGAYRYALPQMQARGMRGTMWVNSGLAITNDPDFMTIKQLDIAYKLGWDIGNHTVNHPDDVSLLDKDRRIHEYKDNRDWILENGWTRGAEHVCYPMGSHDDDLVKLMPELGFKSARTTIYGLQAEKVEDIYRLKCIPVGRDTRIEYIKSHIDRAVQTGSDIFFMYHNVVPIPDKKIPEQSIYDSLGKFIDTLDYVQDYRNKGLVEVKTISEWYDNYKKNN